MEVPEQVRNLKQGVGRVVGYQHDAATATHTVDARF